MKTPPPAGLTEHGLDELAIDDEASFAHVGLYGELKQVLREDDYRFRVLPSSLDGRWDRALLLNLTFWGSGDDGDVLAEAGLAADVVAHAAWHHLAVLALGGRFPPTAATLFFAEAIASAFDLYLVGRLLGHSPASTFLESQVAAMAESASAAGLPAEAFARLLADVALDPDRAFSDLRELLADACAALFSSSSSEAALGALAVFDDHRFASLLHRYELSNWILHARSRAVDSPALDARVAAIDLALRQAPVALDWLRDQWILPRLA